MGWMDLEGGDSQTLMIRCIRSAMHAYNISKSCLILLPSWPEYTSEDGNRDKNINTVRLFWVWG